MAENTILYAGKDLDLHLPDREKSREERNLADRSLISERTPVRMNPRGFLSPCLGREARG